jgi:Integrase zinc binding domain
VGTLNITADKSLLNKIITGYETDDFAQQLTRDISMGSIEGATLTDKLLYVGCRLVIPRDLHICELLYNLAHDTLGHFGFDKSYESLQGSYYWLNMCCNLKNAYIPSCAKCQ